MSEANTKLTTPDRFLVQHSKRHPEATGELARPQGIHQRIPFSVNCYMGRAGLINSGGASAGKDDLAQVVRTAVINKRPGAWDSLPAENLSRNR